MKILLSLPESPFDPTNGAARSMRTIAELMAAAGHEVRCVATTATERQQVFPFADWNRSGLLGYMLTGSFREVQYRCIDVQGDSTKHWRKPDRELKFDAMFDYQIQYGKPDLLLCYGGHPTDIARFHRAKRAGCKIVFGLRNYGYQRRGFLDFADGVLTSSRFLTNWYRDRFGIESTSLPLPIWPEDVITEKHEPIYFTAINPTREKGLMILQTVLSHLARTRPDIPFMIVTDGRDIDFTGAQRLPWQANPKEIYRQTKVLLVPSIWEEPAGRVIAEAMLNGIPPIITDRGGMVETANGGATVLPLAKELRPSRSTPVPMCVAQPWIDEIIRLHDDETEYNLSRVAANLAGNMYHPSQVIKRYEQYFEGILAGELTPAGCGAHK